ncbi:MAG: minichromosome maintenance protein MCM [Candidatus Nanohaloarchaeota archaeon QJJ-9]|nr:minichromosome maintenance protein MCM [Candidatus Nanohaloarchaeota archaeon QJJ-9]
MEYSDKTSAFEQFFREAMKEELGRIVSEGEKAAVIDFNELEKQQPELAESFLDEPEETLDAAEDSLEKLSFVDKDLNPRITDLPESEHVAIRNLRSDHLGRMIGIRGIVKRASEVRPEVVSATFECTNCGDMYEKEQDSAKLKSPYKCDCGNRNFEAVDKTMEDVQAVTIEEDPQQIKGSEQPRKIGVYLRKDLVDPDFQSRIMPGNKVILSGILREKPKSKSSKRYDLYMEGNYLEPIQREFEQIKIKPEDKEEIQDLSDEEDIFDRIVDSIAPSIYGHRELKKAIALQMFSGVQKSRPDGTETRGDIHVLLIGEPGTGKSQLLKFAGDLAPKGKYVAGKGATAAGITATVVKDEITGDYALEAGALVLANKGLATVDEIDKMEAEDRSSMHEAMEQGTITVSKANIQATLQCRTSILAAGNPKFGRFDPYQPVSEQINLSDTLLSRFDLLFPVKDEPSKSKDEKLSDHIMSMHTDPEDHSGSIETEKLRKYIAYAKKNVRPDLTEEAQKKIKDFYVDTRMQGSSDGEQSKVPITARQLEALIRLSEASARLRLSDKVEEKDAQRAIDLLTHSLKEIGVVDESGEFDIDKLETGMSSESRNNIQVIMNLVKELSGGSGEAVPIEDVYAQAEEEGIGEEKAEEIIDKLKREGEIYEPKNGHIGTI